MATPTLQIGFIPLVDCALLAIAKEKYFFSAEGLNVELHKAQSWGAIHENLLTGKLDAAHLLLTMPIQSALFQRMRLPTSSLSISRNDPLCHAFTLSCNGNGIIFSNALWNAGVKNTQALKYWLEEKPDRSICLGVVYPQGTQEYLIRAWLALANLSIGPKIQLKIIAPQEMVGRLRKGEIDGFCAGDPWSRRAMASKLGRLVVDSRTMFPGLGEKVLGVRKAWHQEHQHEHRKLIRALTNAASWLDDLGNIEAAVEIVASKRYVNTPKSVVDSALRERAYWQAQIQNQPQSKEPISHKRFINADSNLPCHNHIQWYLEQMHKFGHADAQSCLRIDPASICLSDFYHESLSKKSTASLSLFSTGLQAIA